MPSTNTTAEPAREGALTIFSGKVPQGLCGKPVGFSDMNGKPLHVGDIVLLFTVKGHDPDALDYFPDHLSAVVSDGAGPFVMGIESVAMDAPGIWRVMKVKGFDEAVAGEHWDAYGFSYRINRRAARAAETEAR